MTKKKYLEELDLKLTGLTPEEKKKIISDYSSYIDNEVNNGTSLKKVLLGLGKPSFVARRVKKELSMSNFDYLGLFINKATDFLQDFFKLFSNKKVRDIVRVLVLIICLVILSWIIKVPFMCANYLFKCLFVTSVNVSNLQIITYKLIEALVGLFYLITMFIFTYHYVKHFLIDHFSKRKLSFDDNGDKSDDLILSANFARPFMTLTKLYGIIVFVILIVSMLLLFGIMITTVCFVINNAMFWSIFVIIAGLVMLMGALTLLVWAYLTSNTKSNSLIAKLCICSVSIMIIGGGVLPFELSSYNLVNHNILLEGESGVETFILNEGDYTNFNFYNNGKKVNISYIIDNELDNIRVDVLYPIDYYNVNSKIYQTEKNISMNIITLLNENTSVVDLGSKLLSLFVTNTSNKVLYNYFDINMPEITVRANSDTMKLINQK